MKNDKLATDVGVPQQLASVAVPGEGFRRHAAAVVIDSRGFGDDGRSIILNPDAVGLSVPSAPGSIGPVCVVANATDGTGCSPLWRTAIHEGSHICASRFQNLDVAGSTLIEGPDYQGLTWSPGSKRALRGKAAYDSDGSDAHDAVAVRVADNVSQFMTGAGETAISDIYSIVQAHVVDLMAGGAGEMVFLGDAPPMYMASDVLSANALAGIICRSPASRASFIEHAYQEALAIITVNKPIVLALANALIDHPKRTLDGAEIDQCIADTLDREARQAEHKRRTDWAGVITNAADFFRWIGKLPNH
jgi:hypothetical protein